jgi:hypothetical protein
MEGVGGTQSSLSVVDVKAGMKPSLSAKSLTVPIKPNTPPVKAVTVYSYLKYTKPSTGKYKH